MHTHDRQILSLAVPSIVSNITVPLLGLADVAIVGHIGNATHIGAIAIGSMIFNVVYWLFGFLRMGTSGMTSQSYGRQDMDGCIDIFIRSIMVAMSVAVSFLVFQLPLRSLAIWLMQTPSDILPMVKCYFNIVIWGAPAMLGLYAVTGWYVGMQNTRIPMLVAVLQNVVNVMLSLFFVFFMDMGIIGVATGTLVAQWSGLLLSLALFFINYASVAGRGTTNLFRRITMAVNQGSGVWRQFFMVNRDIFLRTLFLVAVNMFFTSAGASQGAMILAVNTLLMVLFTLFSYVMDGFAYAGEALAGRYYGAKDLLSLQTVVSRLFRWGLIMVIVFTLVYVIGGSSFLSLLTDDNEVVRASNPYIYWAFAIPAAGVSAFVYDGIFIGITATQGMLQSSLVATVVFFVLYLLLFQLYGNHALWFSFIVYLLMRGLVQRYLFHHMPIL